MIKMVKNFFKDEEGATMVEYGLMLALIAIVCIVAVGLIGLFLIVAVAVAAAALVGSAALELFTNGDLASSL